MNESNVTFKSSIDFGNFSSKVQKSHQITCENSLPFLLNIFPYFRCAAQEDDENRLSTACITRYGDDAVLLLLCGLRKFDSSRWINIAKKEEFNWLKNNQKSFPSPDKIFFMKKSPAILINTQNLVASDFFQVLCKF